MLGLAAENGFFYRWPDGKEGSETNWQHLIKEAGDGLWIESVRDIMKGYTAKTDGSFIEDRESMIIWNFKDSDPEFASWQSKELRNHIETFFSQLQIRMVSMKKSIQVVHGHLTKVILYSPDLFAGKTAEAHDEPHWHEDTDRLLDVHR